MKPKRTSDALKLLGTLCRNRKLRLTVMRHADGEASVVICAGQDESWEAISVVTGPALATYLRAHSEVLGKFPPILAKGGARFTRESRAVGRARVLAEQQAAREVR